MPDPKLAPNRPVSALAERPYRAWLARIAVCAVLAFLPSTNSGCSTSCDDGDSSDDPPVVYEGGYRNEALTYYESDTWEGAYLYFPPKRTYDIRHGLGNRHVTVNSYVGFNEYPLGSNGNGNIAEVAGNIVIIEYVDDETVRVRNDTCETYYLRVVATAPEEGQPEPDPDLGAGGSDTSAEDASAGGSD
jgi:hypothetical protein